VAPSKTISSRRPVSSMIEIRATLTEELIEELFLALKEYQNRKI
jgi:hypothetical protein